MIFDAESDDFVFVVKTNPIIPIADVRDKDGGLLLPNEYSFKLGENSIVIVDVHFELCAPFFFFFQLYSNNDSFFFFLREIGPYHIRDYQLILNSMHSLPDA